MKSTSTFSQFKSSLLSCTFMLCLFSANAQPGNALNYDGNNDYVIIGPAGGVYAAGSSYTKEAWILYTGNNAINVENINSSKDGFWVENGKIHAANNFDGTNYDIVDANFVATNHWEHVALTYDAATTTMKLYRNGVLVQTNAAAPASASGQNYLGAFDDTGLGGGGLGVETYSWNGAMDEVRIYNTALTQAQVQSDMVSTTSAVPGSLRAYYNFDIGTAGAANAGLTNLPDGSANGFNGTLTNFALLAGPTSNWEESYSLIVPTASAASNINGNYFVANWVTPVASGTIDNYIVDVSTTADFSAPVAGSPFTIPFGTNFTYVYGLSLNTTYYYRVSADKASVTGQGAFSNTITLTTLGVLPVGQLTLSASKVSNGNNLLQWSTASEQNTRYFELQRSDNNRDYNTIAKINAAGNSSSLKEYRFTDNTVPVSKQVLYYRLKITDADGKAGISNIVLVKNAADGSITTYPNPVVNSFVLNVTDRSLLNSKAVLSDVNGHILQVIVVKQTATEVDMSRYASGVYLLKMANGETVKVVK